ncbi:MAG: hypothetical protein IPN42_14820 [Methylococcaceae bacterium]|nr:hypothetical protein [Methylococcaceae bacterium]
MKLIIQICVGVFLGTISAQLVLDRWHRFNQQQETKLLQKKVLNKEKARLEQADRIRTLFLQHRKDKISEDNKPPMGFVPDDSQLPHDQDDSKIPIESP